MIKPVATTGPEQLLRLLQTGLPIAGEDARRLVSQASNRAIADAVAAVNQARGRMANGEKAAFWITGRPGNGKTQSLRQLVYQLPRMPGLGKYALALIDFGQQPDARRPFGLVKAIIQQCMVAGVAVGELEEARRAATASSPQASERIEALAFGFDVLAGLSGLPPVSLVASRTMRAALKLPGVQKWWTHKKFKKRWASHPQLVEFLAAWTHYLLSPTPSAEGEIDSYLGKLASTNRLLDLFGYALQTSQYTTLVLAFDEVSFDALAALKTLWDPPINPIPTLEQRLNIVFVLAAPDSVYQEAERDSALRRRFCDPPSGRSQLSGPTVNAATASDDFTHVTGRLEELLREAEYLRNTSMSPGDLQSLRQRLADEATRPPPEPNDLTWQRLWREVISVMVRR